LNPKVPSPYRVFISSVASLEQYDDNPKKLTIVMKDKSIRGEELASNSFVIFPAYHYDAQNLLADIEVNDLLDAQKAEQIANSNPNLQAFADEFIKPKYAREVGGVVGSGPYQLKEWITGQRLVLEKKENWWGEKVANPPFAFSNKVDEIIYQPIKDVNTKIAAARNEEIDVLLSLTPDAYKTLKSDTATNKAYDIMTAKRWAHGFWYINGKNPKLADKRVRRALAHAVDVESIIDNLGFDMERITTSVLSGMPGYNKDLKPIEFNIEKAKTLLQEAGWKDSNNNGIVDKVIDGEVVELTLNILYNPSRSTQEQQVAIVENDAIKAGIDIEGQPKEPRAILGDLSSRDYDLALWATGEATPWAYDPYESWHTSSDNPSGRNFVGFGNAETDALIEKIRVTINQEERNKLYKEFQQIIYDEQPMIFLYEVPNFIAIHKRFNAKALNYRPNYFPAAFDMNAK